MKNIKFIISGLLVSLLVSCQANTYEEIAPKAVAILPTYEKDFKPIIQSKCIECHGAATAQNQYPSLDTFTEVKNATESGSVLCRINGLCGSLMPQNGAKLPQTTLNTIKKWSETGYTEK